MTAKPALKLDIVGGVDMERDREGLIRDQFQRKLKVQKLNDLIRKGDKVESVDESHHRTAGIRTVSEEGLQR